MKKQDTFGKGIHLVLDPVTDGDLIAHLEKQGDILGYLKALIRKDMAPRRGSAARVEKDFNATLALMRQLGKKE